jgi:hypothetical protein
LRFDVVSANPAGAQPNFLRRFPAIKIEQPAHAFPALDIPCPTVSELRPRLYDPALQPLMIALLMVMLNVVLDGVAQGPFTE